MRDMASLSKKHKSDKHKGQFPHSDVYDVLFADLKDKPIRLLEIGLNRGGSLGVWTEYFSKATILGIDHNQRRIRRLTPRYTVDIVDQSDAEALIRYADEKGPFDIIIDDGSHRSSDQILTFETLWPYLNHGGSFVIEDTITSYDRKFVKGHVPTCVDYFRDLVVDLHNTVDDRLQPYRHINTILFRQNMIIITKE